MSEEELTKEQKLEAARKKFEELKNKKTKKKGKKKGKKSDSKEDTPVDDTLEDSIEPSDELNEEKIVVAKTNLETEATEISNVEKNVDESAAPLKEKEDDTVSKEELETNSKEQLESKVENSKENENSGEKNIENKVSDEDTITEKKLIEVITPLQESSTILKDSTNDEPLEDILSSDATPGSESTFLKSTLQSTIDELKSQLDKSRKDIEQLKAENSDLKLSKMDVEMELESARNDLETQKAQINTLNLQIGKLRVDSSTIPTATVKSDDGSSILSGTDYLNHTSSFQNLSSFNNMSSDYMEVVDIKERLNQWKGWNMDMRSWRSIGMGPYLEL